MNGYLYETHAHTSQTSKCGFLSADDVVERYARSGYTGLVITDHLHPEYLSRIDTTHNWADVMEHFLSGYRMAKAKGDELGLDVILGVELRFPESERDYLVYGIDEQWLLDHPYVCKLSAHEFFAQCGKDVLVIHAHPYRDGGEEVFTECIHGSEIINGNHRHDNYNERALAMCRENPSFFRLAGSDTHRDGDEARAGVLLEERVKDSVSYKKMIESGRFRLWSPSFQDLVEQDETIRQGVEK